jgi:hypothetical protein
VLPTFLSVLCLPPLLLPAMFCLRSSWSVVLSCPCPCPCLCPIELLLLHLLLRWLLLPLRLLDSPYCRSTTLVNGGRYYACDFGADDLLLDDVSGYTGYGRVCWIGRGSRSRSQQEAWGQTRNEIDAQLLNTMRLSLRERTRVLHANGCQASRGHDRYPCNWRSFFGPRGPCEQESEHGFACGADMCASHATVLERRDGTQTKQKEEEEEE